MNHMRSFIMEQPEYAVQIKDGTPRISYSLEQAQTSAQKEANRTHKSVWIECSTGDGYFPLEVINPFKQSLNNKE